MTNHKGKPDDPFVFNTSLLLAFLGGNTCENVILSIKNHKELPLICIYHRC